MKCEYCGGDFKPTDPNQTKHESIYDCCDIVDPNWMIKWARNLKKNQKKKTESNFVKWSKNLILIILMLSGCTDPNVLDQYDPKLTIWMNMNYDGEFYQYDYPNEKPHSYTKVFYKSNPMERVFWFSSDSFYVNYQDRWFGEPIINYSTYTSSDSLGRQMIYTNESMVGDTLSIKGCVYYGSDQELCKDISFIVY